MQFKEHPSDFLELEPERVCEDETEFMGLKTLRSKIQGIMLKQKQNSRL